MPVSVPEPVSPPGKSAFFNRELSWLAFNRRVLDQAQDNRYPLLERVRFLSFVSSNLDEFYEIRVAGLLQQVDGGSKETGLDGLNAREQLRRIRNITVTLVHDTYATWRESLVPDLKRHGIRFKRREELTKTEVRWLEKYFSEQVYPVLTPLAIDPAHPFPQLANKSLNVMLWLDDPATPETEIMMAIIPVPRILPRLVRVEASRGTSCYVLLSDLLKMYADRFFPGFKVRSIQAFRITRNSDLYIDEEETQNLLHSIEAELYKMRRGAAVRLEIETGVHRELLGQLLEAVKLPPEHVFEINGPVNLMRLLGLPELIDRPELKFPAFVPYEPPALGHGIFNRIDEGDIMLHHPFDSFGPVVQYVEDAARDPDVLAIKLTLYRTSSDSPVVKALMTAARNGKQVTALIELKARFDEAQNIHWARQLEEAGVHVVYGMVGLKTHCKCCLVVRRHGHRLRRYAHLGTGNYNPRTARLYTDISLFTADEGITEEVADVFNALTGFGRAPTFERLLVAPFNLHSRIQELIREETANARKGLPARIIVKANSLVDRDTIENLYEASQAGVQIDLIIRGICCLVPGVKGMSENIRVRSLLGRYLEHSRLFYFENASNGRPHIFVGSADWMQRNFFRRIEVVFPIEDETLRQRIVERILPVYLADNRQAKLLKPNGAYLDVPRRNGEAEFSAQDFFIAEAEASRAELPAPPLPQVAGVVGT